MHRDFGDWSYDLDDRGYSLAEWMRLREPEGSRRHIATLQNPKDGLQYKAYRIGDHVVITTYEREPRVVADGFFEDAYELDGYRFLTFNTSDRPRTIPLFERNGSLVSGRGYGLMLYLAAAYAASQIDADGIASFADARSEWASRLWSSLVSHGLATSRWPFDDQVDVMTAKDALGSGYFVWTADKLTANRRRRRVLHR